MKFMKLLEFFNRYLERQVLHFIAICVICIVVIAVIFRCVSPDKWNNSKSLSLGSDFAHFFVAGKILNEHGYLYDPNLRAEIWRQVKSVESENPPFLYAPFFALPFRALAMLGFTGSYLCWLPILVILYGSGLVLVLKTTKIPGRDYVTVILLAFSFGPFIMNCFLFGHVSPFGFFAISLAYYFYHNKKDFLSGMALALCLYKPNFLIFILPLLIISQKKKILLGFGSSAFMLGLLSLLTVGFDACLEWVNLMVHRQIPQPRAFYRADYMITNAYIVVFAALLFFRKAFNRRMVVVIILTCTAAFNLYCPMHDSIIIVISLILTINACGKVNDPKLKALLILIYLSPVPSQIFALYTGIQLYSVILILLGIYQLLMSQNSQHPY